MILGVIVVLLIVAVSFYHKQTQSVDPKQMIESGVDVARKTRPVAPSQEQMLRVQLALVDFIAKTGLPPSNLSELVPVYFDAVPKDPETGQPFQYARNGSSYSLGELARKADAAGASSKPVLDEDFVNPNTLKLEEVTYDPSGKRDPFQPFDFAPKQVREGPLSALEQYAMNQLRLTAVIADPQHGHTAVVEDASGKGFSVRVGSRIGNEGGVVVSIEPEPKPGRLKILVSSVDFTGKRNEKISEMKIQPPSEKKSSDVKKKIIKK